MIIALAQYRFRNNDICFNITQIKRALEKAKGRADIVCFGEAFLQGFDSLSWNFEKDKNVAISQDSDVMKEICSLTTLTGVDLVFGYIERVGESLFSSCAVIEKGKIIHNYRRISRGWKEFWKTDFHYCEGTEVKPFSYRGRKFLLCLCGDMWDYPERFKGKLPIIWSVFVSYEEDELCDFEREYSEQAEKVADRIFMVNSISENPRSLGGSFYFSKGKIEGKIGFDEEDLLFVEGEKCGKNILKNLAQKLRV